MITDPEEQHLHNMLEELFVNPGQPSYLIFMKSIRDVDSGQQVLLMERLKYMHLVRSPSEDKLYLQLTPQGIDVARHPGGYLGYQKDEKARLIQTQQQQGERDALERAANTATVSSANSAVSATRAAWVAAGFGLVGVIISLIALLQPDKSEPLQNQLTTLQQQVATLQVQVATRAQPLQVGQPKSPAAPVVIPKSSQPAPPRAHTH